MLQDSGREMDGFRLLLWLWCGEWLGEDPAGTPRGVIQGAIHLGWRVPTGRVAGSTWAQALRQLGMPPSWGAAVPQSRNKKISPEHRAVSASCLASAPSGGPPAALPGPQVQGHSAILDIHHGHTELRIDRGKHSLWVRAKRRRCVPLITR